ncbi:hypothetical protein [Ligaoa zhengdingensis]|uniref:hypothetical protein n=1 Tax=Ligaoa zhengdingensis TaxID=2763658 RepID=UPI0031BA2F9F
MFTDEMILNTIERFNYGDLKITDISKEQIESLIHYAMHHRWSDECKTIAHILFSIGPSRTEDFLPYILQWFQDYYPGLGVIAFLLMYMVKAVLVKEIECALGKACKSGDSQWGVQLWHLTIGLGIQEVDFSDSSSYELFYTFYDESDPQIVINEFMPNRIYVLIEWCYDLLPNEFETVTPFFYNEKREDVVEGIKFLLWNHLITSSSPPVSFFTWYQKIHCIADHFGITSGDFQDPKYSEYFDKYISSQPI